ncbi:MAG TPA: branched-chain amino acid transaminase [Vicinamibacterales bacterium]|nr:branched-chain amino acid transaminase [Vicinamibacterales bacterium]
MNSRYVWMNGTIVESAKATIPFLTAGFHYGIGVFEGIRAYQTSRGPAVFRLRDHLRRFEASARILGFREVPYSVDELVEATTETIRRSEFDECYIRPMLWLADGGWNLTVDSGKPHVGIAVWEQSVYLGEDAPSRGIRACVSSFVRHHPAAMMTKAKICGNYVNSYLAKTDARRQGFDEAIMLDPEGHLTEATGANVFIVRDGRLITPPTDAILEGITRSTMFALAADLGIEAQTASLSRDHLYLADEVFVCGTAAEVVGVAEIDMRRIGSGRTGPITTKLQHAYADAVHGRHARSADWLEYVRADRALGTRHQALGTS